MTQKPPVDVPADIAFVHAIGGRAGVGAWPMQADLPGARFLVRRGFGDDELPEELTVDGEATWLAAQVHPATVLVGHSWSAVAVLATAIRSPGLRGVVVIEPAATFAAADEYSVQEHVRAVSPATAQDERSLELLRRHRPPWETRLTPAALAGMAVPLAVVTGGWSPLYEAIGSAVVDIAGGHHVQIEGAGHRPQDVGRFNDFLLSWVGRL
ncbi:alpha/beta fold hydrolase [Candidatus Blastococcus massiliensis]|uniref:alpha/beta fold hydrolase n=1 Tax=Candidatus Blastococcus massiliensis TaxID=1470358 RepID=UPI0004B218CF|nr:hypothetical protein [Candidatus Blastococcus massiliensis]